MNSEAKSKKQIVKSSSIIGGASVINILIGLIKVKVLAVLLGPAGIGLMSLLTSIMTTAATLSGMGLQTSGVRELAQSNNNVEVLATVRKSLWIANIWLGLLGGTALWLFRFQIAEAVFNDTSRVNDVGLLGLGVFLTLIAGSQTALLQGLRKITELAKVKIISALIATIMGLLSIYFMGERGIIIFVLATPLGGVISAWFYCLRLPSLKYQKIPLSKLIPQWKLLVSLGFVFMLTGLMSQVTQLFVRYTITGQISLEAVGHFQAAWVISMTYIGFVLGAMGADYYPRLTSIIDNNEKMEVLVNQQTEIALVLAAPLLLAMIAFAPYIIQVLYSAEFFEAVNILRWQVLGDVFKILAFPIAFVLIAKGRGKLYFMVELSWNFLYAILVLFGTKKYGLISTGIGFFLSYIVYYAFVLFIVKKIIGYKALLKNTYFTVLLSLSAGLLLLVSYLDVSSWLQFTLGLTLSAVFLLYTIKELHKMGSLGNKLNRIIMKIRK